MHNDELSKEERAKLMEEYLQGGTIDPAQVAGGFENPPIGEYIGKLIDCQVKEIGSNKAKTLMPRFELVKAISRGAERGVGMDAVAFYRLTLYPPKKKGDRPGGVGYRMIMQDIAVCNNGQFPAPKDRPKIAESPEGDGTYLVNPEATRKLYIGHVGKKMLHLSLTERAYTVNEGGKKEVKKSINLKLIGLASASTPAAPAAVAEDDNEDRDADLLE
jgi:hypothetical protein